MPLMVNMIADRKAALNICNDSDQDQVAFLTVRHTNGSLAKLDNGEYTIKRRQRIDIDWNDLPKGALTIVVNCPDCVYVSPFMWFKGVPENVRMFIEQDPPPEK